jgi:hypothetical protein
MEGCSPFFGPEGDPSGTVAVPSGTVAGEISDAGYAGPFCGLDCFIVRGS